MMTETQDELYDIIIRATELYDTDILWHTDTETLYEAIRAMMERKDAEIARLKAQLATTWQPVADGDAITPKRSLYKGLGVDGNRLYITQTNGAKDSIYDPTRRKPNPTLVVG